MSDYRRYSDAVRQYKKALLDFIVEEDRKDPESQHLISSRSPSTFSSRPIDPRLVPRFHRDHAERPMDRMGWDFLELLF